MNVPKHQSWSRVESNVHAINHTLEITVIIIEIKHIKGSEERCLLDTTYDFRGIIKLQTVKTTLKKQLSGEQ